METRKKDELISPSEFARRLGVEQSTVTRAIQSGRLRDSLFRQPNGRFLIEPELGATEFQANKLRGSTQARDRERMEEDGTDNASIAVFEKERLRYQAGLARLKFEEMAATLLDAKRVHRAQFEIARTIRDGIMAVPDRVSAELAGITDAFEINQILTREIRQVLENLKDDLEIQATGLDEEMDYEESTEVIA